jgi:hypothetical protein
MLRVIFKIILNMKIGELIPLNILILTTLIIFSTIVSSCGFPGPLITYNRKSYSHVDSTTKTKKLELCYFCFDYDRNFQCQKYKDITIDTLTNKLVFIIVIKGTELGMRDGRQKRIARTKQFDKNGTLIKKIKSNSQTYGRVGRLKNYREVEYLENGQKKITIKKGTKHNPSRLEIVRYIGKKYKNN